MKATLTLLPPEPGFGRRLAEVDVLQEIAHKYHIAQGLDRDAVHRLMEHPVYEQQTAGKNKSEQDWCHARSEATTDVHRPSGQDRSVLFGLCAP